MSLQMEEILMALAQLWRLLKYLIFQNEEQVETIWLCWLLFFRLNLRVSKWVASSSACYVS